MLQFCLQKVLNLLKLSGVRVSESLVMLQGNCKAIMFWHYDFGFCCKHFIFILKIYRIGMSEC